MPELANFITIANRFWQQVRANRLGVDPETVAMPKRKRPQCMCDKPKLNYRDGKWTCHGAIGYPRDCVVGSVGDTPEQALARFIITIHDMLDRDRIDSGDFIYIDCVLTCCPPTVFYLLPKEIQDYYEPLESSTK